MVNDLGWLYTLAWTWIVLSILSAVVIIADMAMGRKQRMFVMAITWPVTALYMGPFGLLAYWLWGRAPARDEKITLLHPERPFWIKVFISSTHCGAGCTIGDIISDTLLFLFAFTVFSSPLFTSYIFNFAAAYLIGILFQFFPIRLMRNVSPSEALVEAVKADTISLVAFEVGLFVWMGFVQICWFSPILQANDPLFWFMMQVGMCIGFLTTYPANWILVRMGIKQMM